METQTTRSICCYCGTGCGVLIRHIGGKIIDVVGDPDHPANFGRLCSKGSTLHLTTLSTTRATQPLRFAPVARKSTARRRTGEAISWDTALREAADKFAAIIEEHGPDAVAFYVSGQLLTEDYYVFNKLARALVGTHNIDSNSRLCMSSAVSAYKRTLGADAPPSCYEDLDHADVVLVAGANPAWAHPILFRRLADARAKNPAQKLIVIDPRRTDTAAAADLHLQIEPGTDAILFGAMLHVLLWEGLTDGRFIAAHTEGFEAAREAVRELTPASVANTCGVKAADIVTAARWFGSAQAALSLWCQGLNQSQHGSDNGAALIHLHLATGQIGRPGAGPFSLTGQPNAMGGRETGTMANLLPGHRDPASAADRAEVAAFWGVPALPERPGKTATEIIDGLHDGSIKAVWIACTNPAQSLPDQTRVRAALDKAEYVVVQEAFADTETCAYADLLLPASTWGEKDGTVTNSERRISRVRAAVPPPGEARADWTIARDFARALAARLDDADRAAPTGAEDIPDHAPPRLPGESRDPVGAPAFKKNDETKELDSGPGSEPGVTLLRRNSLSRTQSGEGADYAEESRGTDAAALFGWTHAAEVFAEHAALTAGRDLDFAALDYEILERDGPQQWPYSAALKAEGNANSNANSTAEGTANSNTSSGTSRLYTNARFATETGRARFVPIRLATTAEATSARFPLHLNTGRLRDQWHGMSRTGTLARLYNHTEHCALALAPAELARRDLAEGELVRVKSARGSIVLPVAADTSLKSGHASIPMHWGRRRLNHGAANELLAAVVDPYSKQPELKHAAIRIDKADLPWRGVVLLAGAGANDAASPAGHASGSQELPANVSPAERALALNRALSAELAHFDYAALSLAGRDAPLCVLHLAHAAAPEAAILDALLAAGGIAAADPQVLVYEDATRGIRKLARVVDGRLTALACFGETAATGWLREAMLASDPVDSFRRYLFAPLATPPVARPARGRIVCNCKDVSENEIRAAIAAGIDTPEKIRDALGAGASCGSCLVEVGRLCAATSVMAA